jgi:hypothetical protein
VFEGGVVGAVVSTGAGRVPVGGPPPPPVAPVQQRAPPPNFNSAIPSGATDQEKVIFYLFFLFVNVATATCSTTSNIGIRGTCAVG